MPGPRRLSAPVRLFKLLLRLLPAEFRGDFGADMEADFTEQLRDAQGRRATAALWWRTLPSMMRTGLIQHADAFIQDARFALRSMGRTPMFTAVALLMIALGTGANAAMFSVIDGVMLRSPFADPDRLAIVLIVGKAGHASAAVSLAQYRSLREHASVFSGIAALAGGRNPILTGLGEPRRMKVECVTRDMFSVLGSTPMAGRTFAPDEDRTGDPPVIVVSHDFWQRELTGAADAIGRTVTLNGMPTTIVGIMPRSFGGPFSRNSIDGWLPLGLSMDSQPQRPVGDAAQRERDQTSICAFSGVLNVFARVVPGATLDSAASQATDSTAISRLEDWQGRTGGRVRLTSLEEQTFSDLRTPLLALLGAVGFVLLIACANIANLQLERVFGRRRELAVRMAIGATRGRIVRQTLTENLLLYAAGGALGVIAAHWALSLIVGLLPSNVPHLEDVGVNMRVLAATLSIACLAGLAVGSVPAMQATSPRLADDLRVSSRTSEPRAAWIRQSLVAGQIALSLTLTVGAALMMSTFLTLRPASPGFTANDKVTAAIRLRRPSSDAPALFFTRLFDRLREIPGVQAVCGSTYLPMSGNVATRTVQAGGLSTTVWTGIVTPSYFDEMKIPITRGRGFSDTDDRSGLPVAVVNETMARTAWPGGDPIGATVFVPSGVGAAPIRRQIVGVLRDTRSLGVDLKTRPELYVPFAQDPAPFLNVIIRTADPWNPGLPAQVRGAVAALDPLQVVDDITPFQDVLDSRVAWPRLGASLLGAFAAMALLLAAVGLTASIAWWVTQRTREIGVRMALGASPARVTHMFLRQALMLTTAGIVLGICGAAASTRLLESWLYGVSPLDPRIFTGSAIGMIGLAALASYWPARRASRIDPLVALKAE